MCNRIARKSLCVLMAIVLPAAMVMAEAPAAMLYATGNAMLNGNAVSRSSAVFAGDKIQTSQNSSASLNLNGSTVLVPANTAIEFKGDGILLQSGSVTISTTSGLKAEVGALTIAPRTSSAKFEIRAEKGDVFIAARSGELSLTDAKGTTTLQSGDTTTKSAKTGKTVSAGHGKAIAIGVGVAAAGTAAAVAATAASDSKATSPARP